MRIEEEFVDFEELWSKQVDRLKENEHEFKKCTNSEISSRSACHDSRPRAEFVDLERSYDRDKLASPNGRGFEQIRE